MPTPPTLLVLADDTDRWQRVLVRAIETHWPVVVVAPRAVASAASAWVATRDLVVLSDAESAAGPAAAVAAGVAARADARGWLVLPPQAEGVQAASIVAVAQALDDHPVACAQHRGRRGLPVGFAPELLPDLLALAHGPADGVRRLLGRYPAAGVEVDDPAVVEGAMLDEVTPSGPGALHSL